MKLLGIDYGEKRIGLAISDDLGLIARPIPTLKVKSLSDSINKLQRIIKKQKIDKVVVGLPLGPKGGETKQSIQTRYFVDALKSTNGVKIDFWNEAHTSARAIKKKGHRNKKKAKTIDSEAARIILQEYMDNKKSEKKYGKEVIFSENNLSLNFED